MKCTQAYFRFIHVGDIAPIANLDTIMEAKSKGELNCYPTSAPGEMPVTIEWSLKAYIADKMVYSLVGQAIAVLSFVKGENPRLPLKQFISETFDPIQNKFSEQAAGTKVSHVIFPRANDETAEKMIDVIIEHAKKELVL